MPAGVVADLTGRAGKTSSGPKNYGGGGSLFSPVSPQRCPSVSCGVWLESQTASLTRA